MADELIIQWLQVFPPEGEAAEDGGQIVVDAVIETGFSESSQGTAGLSITEICEEIERLCENELFDFLEAVVVKLVNGLLDRFPRIDGIELTVKSIEPQMPGTHAESFGARRRRRRAAPGQRIPRRDIKPLPR